MNQSIDALASLSAANQSSRGKCFFYSGGTVVLPFRCGKKNALVSISERSSLFPAHEFTQLVEKEPFFIYPCVLLEKSLKNSMNVLKLWLFSSSFSPEKRQLKPC